MVGCILIMVKFSLLGITGSNDFLDIFPYIHRLNWTCTFHTTATFLEWGVELNRQKPYNLTRNLNVQLNIEKLCESENYIPDQIRKTISISIENRLLKPLRTINRGNYRKRKITVNVLWHKNRKNDLKIDQIRKSQRRFPPTETSY